MRLTQIRPVSAVDVERLIAFVNFADQWVENQPIWAKFFHGDPVVTLVEFVALSGILVLAVFRGAFELGVWGIMQTGLKQGNFLSSLTMVGICQCQPEEMCRNISNGLIYCGLKVVWDNFQLLSI